MPLLAEDRPKAKPKKIEEAFASNFNPPSGRAASPDNPYVYMGSTKSSREGQSIAIEIDDIATYEEVSKRWYTWSEENRSRFRSALALTGIDTKGMTDAEYATAWDGYVKQAAAYYAGGAGKKLTPWDVLATDRRQRESEAKAEKVKGPTTSTSTSLNLSTRDDAVGIASAVSQQLLGRDMTPAEIDALLEKLNTAERANPTVTVQTTNAEGTQQTSTTTGGFGDTGRGAIAEQMAKGSEGYAEYQAATSLYGALMEMM